MSAAVRHWLEEAYGRSYRLSGVWIALWLIIAWLFQTHTLINLDDGWLNYAAGRMLAGDVPYVDFYETNPPLILWMNAIPVWAARVLGLNAISAFQAFILLLALASMALSLQEIKKHPLLGAPASGNIVCMALALAVLGCSALVFGQREHIFILLAMPYLIQSSVLDREGSYTPRQCIIAVLAGIGICLKPYYALIWASGELYSALVRRRFMLLLRPTNLTIAVTGLAYCGLVGWLTPHYLEKMVPLLLLSYGSFTSGGVGQQLLLLSLIYLGPLCLIRLDAPRRIFAGKLAVWFAAACVTALVQHKGWINHFFPAVFMGAFLLSALLAFALDQWRAGKIAMNRRYFALFWALGFIAFLLPVYHMADTRKASMDQWRYIHRLGQVVAEHHAEHQPLMVLSFDLGAAFPAMDVLPVAFPFHFHHMWALPGIINAQSVSGKEANPGLDKAKAFITGTVAGDLAAFKPPLVVVDDNVHFHGVFKNFDFIAYFRQDPLFDKEWRQYREAGRIALEHVNENQPDMRYTVYSRL